MAKEFDKFHLQVFFTKYKEFVDRALNRKNPKEYLGKLKFAGELVSKIDFDKNLLLVCRKDIMKEVFLSGFMNLPTLRDYVLLNLSVFFDIHCGGWDHKHNEHRTEDVGYEDEYDLLQDVLCVYCNNYDVHFGNSGKNEDVLINTMMRRYEYVENDSKKPLKLTWVFAMGNMGEIENKFPAITNFFKAKSNHSLFQIVDLNSLIANDSRFEVTKVESNTTSSNTGTASDSCFEVVDGNSNAFNNGVEKKVVTDAFKDLY